jgi:tetratricopeptide (TPR) repeat protein
MKKKEENMKTGNRIHVWNPLWVAGLLFAVNLLLHGCAARPPVGEPVVGKPPVHEGTAAGTLLASAHQAVQAGQFNRAEVTLERALRVEPRNAELWHEMAQVKYGQEDYGQAVQFCLKANSLAGRDSALIKQNWLLMSRAYAKMGDVDKAEQARMKAAAAN